MASSTKPRKKKSTVRKNLHVEKNITVVVKKVLTDMFFVGTSHNPCTAINAQDLRMRLPKDQFRPAVRVVLDNLLQNKRPWALWVGVFFKNEDGTISTLSGNMDVPNTDLHEFGKTFEPTVDILIDTLIAKENDETVSRENLVGYGYFFSHATVWDIEESEERFVDLFLPKMFDRDPLGYAPLKMGEDQIVAAIAHNARAVSNKSFDGEGWDKLEDKNV